MVYGINFNGTEIPAAIARKFSKELRIYNCSHCGHHVVLTVSTCPYCKIHVSKMPNGWERFQPKGETGRARLQGVATDGEQDAMVTQASNGTRKVFVVPRQTAGGTFYGIYCY